MQALVNLGLVGLELTLGTVIAGFLIDRIQRSFWRRHDQRVAQESWQR